MSPESCSPRMRMNCGRPGSRQVKRKVKLLAVCQFPLCGLPCNHSRVRTISFSPRPDPDGRPEALRYPWPLSQNPPLCLEPPHRYGCWPDSRRGRSSWGWALMLVSPGCYQSGCHNQKCAHKVKQRIRSSRSS